MRYLEIPKAKFDIRRLINYLVYFVLIPIAVALGYVFLDQDKYQFLCILIAIMVLIPFLLRFEGHEHNARELALIATMVAIGIVGRLIFAPLPGFKPVTAIIIIAAVAFGGEAGFVIGALTALLSNVFFGQGPWTMIQMLVWGLIGLIAGWLFYRKDGRKSSVILIALFAFVSGALYSILLDTFWVVTSEGGFSVERFVAYITSSIPFTAIYMVSNVIFILLLQKPILKKLNRIKIKHGVFR